MTPSQFNKLPKAKQRMLVAKDVQKQLIAGLYHGAHHYVSVDCTSDVEGKSSMRDLLKNPKGKITNCTVCARGSLFLSTIAFKNKLSLAAVDSSCSYFNYSGEHTGSTKFLGSVFPPGMQSLIECTYEQGFYGKIKGKDQIAAAKYGNFLYDHEFRKSLNPGWKSDSAVLYWIMDNIIKNKGNFIVPKQFYA